MDNKEPINKYNFETGKRIKKVKKIGYKYLGRGEIGKLRSEIIDGKTRYYVSYALGRSSFSKDKSRFKRIEYWEEDIDYRKDWVEKIIKGRKKIVFNTSIKIPKDRFLTSCEIKLGKNDFINHYDISKSNIVKSLQLKLNDKLRITIEKMDAFVSKTEEVKK